MFAVMLGVGWLLLREPDFGAFVVITAIATAILFLGGMNGTWFAGLLVMMALGFVGLVVSSPYRMQRIFGFMDPWSDPFGRGYQLSHALIAFGRGEWFGVGLGASVEKLLYLPEAHTDFLLAVIGEELGFAGVIAVIALFSWLVLRAFAVGRQAVALERPYPALVAQGNRGLVRGSVVHQHGREHGRAADQGPHPSVHELRRERPARQLHGARGAAANRLGEQATHARCTRMRREPPDPTEMKLPCKERS